MSQDELVDIVDENMNFVRVASKKECHTEGWLHKAVIAVVRNSKGEYLLTRPSSDRQDAGQYVFPAGGHVSAGESEEDALKREVAEELGIDISEARFLGRGIFSREVIGRKENHYMNLYEVITDEPPTLDHEHQDHKYFTEEELKKEIKDNPTSFGDAFYFNTKNFVPYLLV